MSHSEETLLGRWSGCRLLVYSAALGLAGVLPLLVYIAFGPADGNPIGLGLLAVVAVPVAGVGVVVGLLKVLVQYFMRRGE
jgi:hypothetical protein